MIDIIKRFWATINVPRKIMTHGTLCKIQRFAIGIMFCSFACMFVLGMNSVTNKCNGLFGVGTCTFAYVMFIGTTFVSMLTAGALSIWRNSIEINMRMAEDERRLCAVQNKIEKLVEHAMKTGFDFNTLKIDTIDRST